MIWGLSTPFGCRLTSLKMTINLRLRVAVLTFSRLTDRLRTRRHFTRALDRWRACRSLPIWPVSDYALSFLNGERLIRCEARKLVHLPAGPMNLDRICFRRRAETESQD